MSFSLNSRRQLCRWRRLSVKGVLSAVGTGEEVVPASAGCNDFETRWSWPRAATVIPDDADANTAGFAHSAAQGGGSQHAGGHRRESDHGRSNQNRPRIVRKRLVAEN
jgi:hypothetical protein